MLLRFRTRLNQKLNRSKKIKLTARIGVELLENRTLLSVYTPTQIRHAYGFDQISFINSLGQKVVGDGSGQTIAIVDAFNQPNIVSNLATFDQTFGLAAPSSFKIVNQTGGSTLPANDIGWGEEISLDVEWAHAIAPGANILLVEATSNSGSDLLAAVDYARHQTGVVSVSMSWGGSEFSGEQAYDSYFTTPTGHPGVSFLASSGDNGSPAGWPAISQNVVAVGGTSLTLDANNNITKETGWSGSGGGISPYEAQPTYQNGVVTQSTTFRTNPDVAYNADPNTGVYVYDTYGVSGWLQIGGTSAGTPQWAALVAIADQGRAINGLGSLDSFKDTLTKLYQLPATDFHDITSGSNGGFSAGTGYDLVTGLGTPLANKIVNDLVGAASQGAVPAAPAGLTAKPGDTQVTLTWTASSGATSYNVYRGTTSGGEGGIPIATGITTTSFTNAGLTDGTTYYYQVTAVSSAGESAKSAEASATPIAVPAAPANLVATPANQQVALTWNASTGAASYNIYRSTSSGGEGATPYKTGITAANFTDSGLTNGTTYFYQVTAVNTSGESGKSTEASATPVAPVTTPAAPTGLAASAGNQQIVLTWNTSTGATSYNLYRATASGAEGATPYKTGLTSATFTDTGLTNGTTYFYQVTAVNTAGESSKSTQASATPAAPVATPAAPTGLTASAGNQQIVLTWNTVTGASTYNLYRATASGGEGATPYKTGLTAATFTDTGLTNGTTYFYQVTAVNTAGESAKSAEVSATPSAPFSAHINFSSSTTQIPAGYFNDGGQAFGAKSNGLTYGWNIDNTAAARDRDSSLSPDELHDSLVHMQKSTDPNAYWQIVVPNGTYNVHLIAGDPNYIDSIYKISVNGVVAISGTPTSTNHWFENTVTITVTNGLITIANASGSSNNKVDAVDIALAPGVSLPIGGGQGFGPHALANIRISPKLIVTVLGDAMAPTAQALPKTTTPAPVATATSQTVNSLASTTSVNSLVFGDPTRPSINVPFSPANSPAKLPSAGLTLSGTTNASSNASHLPAILLISLESYNDDGKPMMPAADDFLPDDGTGFLDFIGVDSAVTSQAAKPASEAGSSALGIEGTDLPAELSAIELGGSLSESSSSSEVGFSFSPVEGSALVFGAFWFSYLRASNSQDEDTIKRKLLNS